MGEHDFCRELLKRTMVDVRKHVKKDKIKEAWAYKYGFGGSEFHGPDNFYVSLSATCLWEARQQGWAAYLAEQGIEGYTHS